MRLQPSAPFDLAKLTDDQLKKMAKNPDLAGMLPTIQAELNLRTQPKAFLTVEMLKNSGVKPIGETGNSRIQVTVISAEFINPQPGDEMTYQFGECFEVAKIGAFIQIPDEQLDRLDLSMSTQVKVEVALTINPAGGRFVLAAGEINELRSIYVPEKGKTQTLQVWHGPNDEEHFGKTAPAGFVPSRIASYGNLTVLDIVEVNPINLALTNAIVPEDKKAWLLKATQQTQVSKAKNLDAYLAKQAALREEAPIGNPNVAAMAATLETSEELEVAI
jgi:hypothetical protein